MIVVSKEETLIKCLTTLDMIAELSCAIEEGVNQLIAEGISVDGALKIIKVSYGVAEDYVREANKNG